MLKTFRMECHEESALGPSDRFACSVWRERFSLSVRSVDINLSAPLRSPQAGFLLEPRGYEEGAMLDEHSGESRDAADPQTSILAEVSREMVRLYKEQFGRGPTKARSEFAGPDLLICTLEDTFTPAERKLVEMGEHQRMRDTRLYFQHATEDDFRGTVERILDRRVRAFTSGLDTSEDVSAEVFYLEPR
jgi:uncharacterized protein YbcI